MERVGDRIKKSSQCEEEREEERDWLESVVRPRL